MRLKRIADFFTNVVTATVDAGSDGGLQVARLAAEPVLHFAYTFFHNALRGAAPTGMKDSDSTALLIGKNYGKAIGGLYAEK